MPSSDQISKVPTQLIDALKENEDKLVDAVRKLVASVDETVPNLVPAALADNIPSRKAVIDSTFELIEKAIEAQDRILRQIVDVASSTVGTDTAPVTKAA